MSGNKTPVLQRKIALLPVFIYRRAVYTIIIAIKNSRQLRFEVLRYHPWDFKNVYESLSRMHLNGPRVLGGVFGYTYVSAQEDPPTSLWLMWFYGTFFISVSAMNSRFSGDEKPENHQPACGHCTSQHSV